MIPIVGQLINHREEQPVALGEYQTLLTDKLKNTRDDRH
jgi:hypothetical protein